VIIGMKVSKTNIRRLARKYLKWLNDQQWFQNNIYRKTHWTNPLEEIISKKADDPASIWEAVVDHWQATPWDEEGFPGKFQDLYDLVDEYRTIKGVDSTNLIT
jgi:hypothetical protein